MNISKLSAVVAAYPRVRFVISLFLLSCFPVAEAVANICEDTRQNIVAPPGGLVFEVDISDNPGFNTVMNPSVSYLLTSGFSFPLDQDRETPNIPVNQQYRTYVPGNARASICQATTAQPHGFNIGNWPGETVFNPGMLTLPNGGVYSGDPNHPSVNTSWPGNTVDPNPPSCDELDWSVAQGFDVSPSYYEFNNCGYLEPSDSTYTGPIAGSSDASLTYCSTYSSLPNQNGMVVWDLPDIWDPSSGMPEDGVYAIVQDPLNAQLVNNYGFDSPAPPPAGMITSASGGIDSGTFHYVPPGSTVAVCTNGTTSSDVAVRQLSIGSAQSCEINGADFLYSGDPFDFIGDGYTPATRCAEFNCVAEIGQVPLFQRPGEPVWGDQQFGACNTATASDVQQALSDRYDFLVDDVLDWNDNRLIHQNQPPHEFASYPRRYLDFPEPLYIGSAPGIRLNGDEVSPFLQECLLVNDYQLENQLATLIRGYEVLDQLSGNDNYDPTTSSEQLNVWHEVRLSVMAGLTHSPFGAGTLSLTERVWRARDNLDAMLGNIDGSLVELLSSSGVDLTSPLGAALIDSIPDFDWPFHTGSQNYFVDSSTSNDLGTLWQDVRGIVHACAAFSDSLGLIDNLANGNEASVDLPDWTPHIEHPSASLTDYDLTNADFAPVSDCPFAATSANALSGWNQAIGVVQSHYFFEAAAQASGAANYQLWQQQLVPLEAAVLSAQRDFWAATVTDANSMLEYWQSVSAADVLVQLREYRLAVASSASVTELDQLDSLISALELAPQESVAWLLQALGVLQIDPLNADNNATALDMLVFACALQSALDSAAAHEDNDPGDPGLDPDGPVVTSDQYDCFQVPVEAVSKSAVVPLKSKQSSINDRAATTQSLNLSPSTGDDDDCVDPDEPLEPQQWYLKDDDAGINLSGSPLNREILIGLIDTGINYLHEDLSDNIWVNEDENFVNNTDDDNNGCKDDYYGCNMVTMNGNILDSAPFHGTKVAGIMVAGNNEIGIRGINPDAKLITASVDSTIQPWLRAIDYLAAEGAHIINMSLQEVNNGFGGEALLPKMQSYPDILFVVAAGNQDIDVEYSWLGSSVPLMPIAPLIPVYDDAIASSPASQFQDLPNVISVSALDENAVKHFAYGSRSVHIHAPGIDILTTGGEDLSPDAYTTTSGTSFAAPMVSAAASLIMQADPAITAAEVRRRLLASASEQTDITKATVTNGRLDIATALHNPTGIKVQMTPQQQNVYALPGRSDNNFPVYLFNFSEANSSGFALTTSDSRIGFDELSGFIAHNDPSLVVGNFDASGSAPATSLIAGIGMSSDGTAEQMAVTVHVAQTEDSILPIDNTVLPFETGKLNLQYNGNHAIASTGDADNRQLLVYNETSSGNFNVIQSIECNEHCAAGLFGDSLLIADTSEQNQINVYRFDSFTQIFIYDYGLTVETDKLIRRIEVGEEFAAIATTDDLHFLEFDSGNLMWNVSPQVFTGFIGEHSESEFDIEGNTLVMHGGFVDSASLPADWTGPNTDHYSINTFVYNSDLSPNPMVDQGQLPVFPMEPFEFFVSVGTPLFRLDTNDNFLVATIGEFNRRLIKVYERDTSSDGTLEWRLVAETDLNTKNRADLSLRRDWLVYKADELRVGYPYAVALADNWIYLGIPDDARFGYERTDSLVRDGAGTVIALQLVPSTASGGLPLNLVPSVTPYGVSNQMPGDHLGWRLSDVIDGKFLVSRARSQPSGSQPDSGDIVQFSAQ